MQPRSFCCLSSLTHSATPPAPKNEFVFGGSVSALRLSEKGYRVGVLEMGKRWRPQDFPKTNWDARRFLWAPLLKCHGIFKMTLLPHVFILSGAGVGGGSLV